MTIEIFTHFQSGSTSFFNPLKLHVILILLKEETPSGDLIPKILYKVITLTNYFFHF